MSRILVVEDDVTFSRIIHVFLSKHGYEVDVCHKMKDSIISLSASKYDLMLLDYRLPDGTGMDVLTWSKENLETIPCSIFMTSLQDIRTAVQTVRSGAFNYITKPINPEELLLVIEEAFSKRAEPVSILPAEITITGSDFVKGSSAVAARAYEFVDLVAPTDLNVLILGESGTGKEHIARRIHDLSMRSRAPFISVDCGTQSDELAASELFGHVKGAFTGAISDKKGFFEIADGGTLFLDEIGNLSYEVQLKLLRAIQEKTFNPVGGTNKIKTDIRILAATNEDLVERAQNGFFRSDLYHRLNEFSIQVPALRERREDLEWFIPYFLNVSNAELKRNVKGFQQEVTDIFYDYDWPGNLRELKNVIRRAVLLSKSEIAGPECIPPELLARTYMVAETPVLLSEQRDDSEKQMIIQTLQKVRFNKSKAAQVLGIDRKTLYNKLARYGLK
jgi:two-component system response regulator HydG